MLPAWNASSHAGAYAPTPGLRPPPGSPDASQCSKHYAVALSDCRPCLDCVWHLLCSFFCSCKPCHAAHLSLASHQSLIFHHRHLVITCFCPLGCPVTTSPLHATFQPMIRALLSLLVSLRPRVVPPAQPIFSPTSLEVCLKRKNEPQTNGAAFRPISFSLPALIAHMLPDRHVPIVPARGAPEWARPPTLLF